MILGCHCLCRDSGSAWLQRGIGEATGLVGNRRVDVFALVRSVFGGNCAPSSPTIAPIYGLWCELHPICHSRYEEGSKKPRVSHPSSPNPCAQPVDIYADIRTSLYLTCACGMLVGGGVAISVGRGVICATLSPCMHPPMYYHACLLSVITPPNPRIH
jgi:hypothetical protein